MRRFADWDLEIPELAKYAFIISAYITLFTNALWWHFEGKKVLVAYLALTVTICAIMCFIYALRELIRPILHTRFILAKRLNKYLSDLSKGHRRRIRSVSPIRDESGLYYCVTYTERGI